jgi:hypothetical protein
MNARAIAAGLAGFGSQGDDADVSLRCSFIAVVADPLSSNTPGPDPAQRFGPQLTGIAVRTTGGLHRPGWRLNTTAASSSFQPNRSARGRRPATPP